MERFQFSKILILFLGLWLGLYSYADDIYLFEKDGRITFKYNDIMSGHLYQAGDEFVFHDGFRFSIEAFIDSGMTTRIFKGRQISPGKNMGQQMILRLPKTKGDMVFINETIQGADELITFGLRVPKFFRHKESQYIAAEFIQYDETFTRFIFEPEKIPVAQFEKMEKDFRVFLEKLALFNHIEDFHHEQFVYSKKAGWVLLDWTSHHKVRTRSSNLTVFASEFIQSLKRSYQEKHIYAYNVSDEILERISSYKFFIARYRIDLDLAEQKAILELNKMLQNSKPANEIRDFILKQPKYSTVEHKADILNKLKKYRRRLRESGLTIEDIISLRTSHMVDFDEMARFTGIFVDTVATPAEYIKLFATNRNQIFLVEKNRPIVQQTYQSFLDMKPTRDQLMEFLGLDSTPNKIRRKLAREFDVPFKARNCIDRAFFFFRF